MNEDDDPVVQEIPVYLSQVLSEKLFMYQYPVRPQHLSYDDTTVLQSKIKPSHQEVRLELELDTNSPNYDTSKGEQIAVNVDGVGSKREDKKSEEIYFKSKIMDKQVLESTRAVANASNYAVAMLHENELHVTPLRGIVHLRPAFYYLDKSDKRAKDEAKELGEGDQSGEDEEEAKQVTVTFARQENERIKRARERSFGYLSKKSAEEPWYNTQYYSNQTEKAELEKGKLYCSKVNEKPMEMTLGEQEYMQYLVPPEEQVSIGSAIPSSVIPLKHLKLLPLVEQIKHLLQDAKVIRFSQLVSLLGKGQDPLNILRIVQQVAVLVQGNWVVRSDVLYPKNSFSGTSGVPADLMCQGRDYILCMFTQNRFVERNRVLSVVKLPPEDVKEILTQIARVHVKKSWELRLPFDKDFVNRYPEVVQRQQMMWDAKLKQLNDTFNEMSSPHPKQRRKSHRDSSLSSDSEAVKMDISEQKPTTLNNVVHKSRNHRESMSSDNDSGAEGGPRRHKNSAIVKVNKRHLQNVAIKVEPIDT